MILADTFEEEKAVTARSPGFLFLLLLSFFFVSLAGWSVHLSRRHTS
jgi:hypothetical protein